MKEKKSLYVEYFPYYYYYCNTTKQSQKAFVLFGFCITTLWMAKGITAINTIVLNYTMEIIYP